MRLVRPTASTSIWAQSACIPRRGSSTEAMAGAICGTWRADARSLPDRFLESRGATNHRKGDRRAPEVDGELGASLRPQCELPVAGHDHESEALAGGDDSITRLQIEGHVVES